jgi:hypothetical protein
MSAKANAKKYTVADVYGEASKMLRSEMSSIKNKPLTSEEALKMDKLGRLISKMVLKEMKVI